MKDIDHNIKAFESLLDEFKFTHAASQSSKQEIYKRRKKILFRILKTVGGFSLINALVISLYYLIKKVITVVSISKVIVPMFIAVSIGTGGYFGITSIQEILHKEEGIMDTGSRKEIAGKLSTSTKKVIAQKDYVLGIGPISGKSIDNIVVREFTKKLYGKLLSLKGKDYVNFIKRKEKYNFSYSMRGSIEKTGDSVNIFIKVVNEKSSAIVFIHRKKYPSTETLINSSEDIAKKIIVKINK